jgi:hypothetical protein
MGTPVGSFAEQVNSTGNNFTNGLDYNIGYNLPRTPIGQFRLSTEWSQFLNKFTKTKPGYAKNDELIQMTTGRWKSSAVLQWRKGGWDASVNGTFESQVKTGATATQALVAAAGFPDYVKAYTSISSANVATVVYAERGTDKIQTNVGVGYRFGAESNMWVRRTSFRLGINNIFDIDPPLQNTTSSGYGGSIGSSLWIGRAYSFTVSKDL